MEALAPLEAHLNSLIEAQRRAEEEQANREALRAIQRAFREAMLVLPREEYDWFEIQARSPQTGDPGSLEQGVQTSSEDIEGNWTGVREPNGSESPQRQFFDFAGPLHSVLISPSMSTLAVNTTPPLPCSTLREGIGAQEFCRRLSRTVSGADD